MWIFVIQSASEFLLSVFADGIESMEVLRYLNAAGNSLMRSNDSM